MVHPALGAALVGGSFAGVVSRNMGSLNLLSLATGTLTGVWLAQNHPESVPNLKDELRKFARAASEHGGDDELGDARWTRAAIPLDETLVGASVKEAVDQLRVCRRSLARADTRAVELAASAERLRMQMSDAQASLEKEREEAIKASAMAAISLQARMIELKRERRERGANRERIEAFLSHLRELREEIGGNPLRASMAQRLAQHNAAPARS
jgi:hypothetical protein